MLYALAVIGVLLIGLFLFLFAGWPSRAKGTIYGVSWSRQYAAYLGVDTTQGLKDVLDDLGVRHFRIPVYWNEVESIRGTYNFQPVKEQLDEIAARQGHVILAIGAKLPRWPEIWMPDWAKTLSVADREQAQRAYLEAAYRAFADHPAVEAWQVENEPSFDPKFGEGQPPRAEFMREEMKLVRQWEKDRAAAKNVALRPVYTTESGELSLWFNFSRHVDGIGISAYRVVVNPTYGIWRYWYLPSWFYDRKALLLRPLVPSIFVSEMQMEPWVDSGAIIDTNLDDQFKTFDLKQMQKNFSFSEHLHFPRVYFWGVEWWYWMKTIKNHPEFWNEAKTFFKQ